MPSKCNQTTDKYQKNSDPLTSDLETNMGSILQNEIKEEPDQYVELEEKPEIFQGKHQYFYEDIAVFLKKKWKNHKFYKKNEKNIKKKWENHKFE